MVMEFVQPKESGKNASWDNVFGTRGTHDPGSKLEGLCPMAIDKGAEGQSIAAQN
jgi:hypothetical protein